MHHIHATMPLCLLCGGSSGSSGWGGSCGSCDSGGGSRDGAGAAAVAAAAAVARVLVTIHFARAAVGTGHPLLFHFSYYYYPPGCTHPGSSMRDIAMLSAPQYPRGVGGQIPMLKNASHARSRRFAAVSYGVGLPCSVPAMSSAEYSPIFVKRFSPVARAARRL